MAQSTMIATKVSTKTKVAVGIAVVAGGLAIANALIPLITFSVSILAPANKATVSGKVALTAQTSQAATSVGFSVTPSALRSPVIAATGNTTGKGWTATWDTTSVPDGAYTIVAGAVDAKGKKATSGTKTVNVQNQQTPPPTPTGPTCGNGQCETGETTESCAADCPAPLPVPTPPNGTMSYLLAPDDTASEAGLVVLGNEVVLAKFRLTAVGEELQQTKLRIALAVSENAMDITMLSLYDGATLVVGPAAPSAAGTFDFSGFVFTVPQDSSKTLTAKATLSTIANGAASGRDLQLKLHVPATDDGSFEYVGVTSAGIRRAQAGGDVAARRKIAVKTRPVVSLAPLPTTSLTTGTVVAYRFTATADAAEQVSLKKVSFKLSTSGLDSAATTTVEIREVGQGSAIAAAGTLSASGSDCGFTASVSERCVRMTLNAEQTIAAGTSQTYELRITYIGGMSPGSVMSTTILGDATWKYGTLSSLNPSNFIWSDNAAIPHSASSADWADGAYVRVLPGDAQTLIRS